MKREGVSQRGGDIKGIYAEALTAEIFKALIEIIPLNTSDIDFLKAHEMVKSIISREYVEKEDRL